MIYEKCEMCGSKNIEEFHNTTEWKTAVVCYDCLYLEIKKRFYVKSKEEEKILCDIVDKENKSEG